MKVLPLLLVPATLLAQSNPAPKAAQDTMEIRALRESFAQVLSTVHATWFGTPYKDINAVELNGSLAITPNGAAVAEKIQQLTKGAVKAAGTKRGEGRMSLSGTYFANGAHLCDFAGDFGTIRSYRRGAKGFWYCKEQNAYTLAIDVVPGEPPQSYMGWFHTVVADIKDVYVKGQQHRVSRGPEVTSGGRTLCTVVFDAPTAPYDPKKREQAAGETFGFWKKGRAVVTYDKGTNQPVKMHYANTAQGVSAGMDFVYDKAGRIQKIQISNQSKQFEGPGFISVSYGGDGLVSNVTGELTGKAYKIAFNLNTAWAKGRNSSKLTAVAPMGAQKLGREDMELRLAMNVAGPIGDLQRFGFNVMAPKVMVKPAGK